MIMSLLGKSEQAWGWNKVGSIESSGANNDSAKVDFLKVSTSLSVKDAYNLLPADTGTKRHKMLYFGRST